MELAESDAAAKRSLGAVNSGELGLLNIEAMSKKERDWLEEQRERAVEYLKRENVDHLGVGDYPAFHVFPYLALWVVQSKTRPGCIGWWVVTGDLPTDYIGSEGARHPRLALKRFAQLWREVSDYMLRGEEHPNYCIGTPDQWPVLGDLLQRRAGIFEDYANDDSLWASDEA